MTTKLNLAGRDFDIEVLAGYVDVYIETDDPWDYKNISFMLNLENTEKLIEALNNAKQRLQSQDK